MSMTTTIIAGVIFIAGLFIGLFLLLYLTYFKKSVNTVKVGSEESEPPKTGLTFRREYLILPFTILITSVIVATIFFPQLSDVVAYRFDSNGMKAHSAVSP